MEYLERFRHYTAWHAVANERRYDAPADPWRLLPVDPATVESHNQEPRLNWGLGRVQGGDWDRPEHREPLRETTLYRSLVARYEEGADWEETPLYRQVRDRFADGETVRGYGSIEEYRSVRCAYVDDLYRSIKREGYRPNEAAGHDHADPDNPFEDAYANHLEPLVVIGRDGDVCLAEGFHRFCIAAILGIEEVPVYVLCRHEGWQRVRDRIHGTNPGEHPPGLDAHTDHPDLRDLR